MSSAEKVRTLNDHFRKAGKGGVVMISMGIHLLGRATVDTIMKQLGGEAGDASIESDEDHDIGLLKVNSRIIHWEIDCYNKDFDDMSPDPADPEKTTRVMTVLLSTEL
ncbi:DUF3768 domain-containing protein [Leisingera sp. M523]|nr:DUF3768 domain-containing protein [Leisingera sp. M523]